MFWKFPESNDRGREQPDEEPEEEASRKGRGLLARGYVVFNAAQVDGYTPPQVPELNTAQRIDSADRFFTSLRARCPLGRTLRLLQRRRRLHHDARVQAVSRRRGLLLRPLPMRSPTGAEHAHRLNRDLSTRFGSEAYAMEELVAELGAAFVCATLGISSEPRPDHAAYIESWLSALRRDKRAIFTAASKAQAAIDWMHEQQPRKEEADGIALNAA